VLSLPLLHRWPLRRGLAARATWRRRPRRGVDRSVPPACSPDIPIPSETGDSEGNDPDYNLCGGGDSDQDGSMGVGFH
jgi:hypothetical protein